MRIGLVGVLAIALAGGSAALAQPRAGTDPSAAAAKLPPLHVASNAPQKIPFTVPPEATPDGYPVQIQFFVSLDQGRTWGFLSQQRPPPPSAPGQPPNTGYFRFEPKRDGEYWLGTRSLDRDNRPSPAGNPDPQLRLIIDTEQPRLALTAEASPSGEVLLTWQATDARIDPASFRLECQSGGSNSALTSVTFDSRDVSAITGGFQGRAAWKPPAGARVAVFKAEVRDTAKNVTVASRQVFLSIPGATADTGPGSALRTMTPIEAQPLPGSGLPRAGSVSARRPPGADASGSLNREQTGSGPFGDVNPQAKSNPGRLATFPRDQAETVNDPPRYDDPAPAKPTKPATPEVDPYADQPRLINKKRFNLEYDVESVGVGGVAEVELWGTSDKGQTWLRWGADPDLKSPMEVDVNNEAVYGFRIVVVGRNGLASIRPKPGDAADVWVQIDTVSPDARISSVTYGQGEEAGKLVIRWEAVDAHLAQRAVSLLMSDRPDGGFSVIAAGLANSGQYLWQYDPRAPQQLYLRLEVRDEAGNVGVHQLGEPIRVEGLTPKGRIRSVAPIETGRSPFRSPLFK